MEYRISKAIKRGHEKNNSVYSSSNQASREEEEKDSMYTVQTKLTSKLRLKGKKKKGEQLMLKQISFAQFCLYMSFMMLVFIITFILFWILAVLSKSPCPNNIDYVTDDILLNVKNS